MLRYELKKFFSKMVNRVIFVVLALAAVIISFLAADSMQFTDADGEHLTGIGKLTAGRRLGADKERWKGELTPEKIADAAESYFALNQQYPEEIPDTEWGKTVQAYWDILRFGAGVYATKTDFRDLDNLAEQDLDRIYETYAGNLQSMAKEYGDTPEQEDFLKKRWEKIKMPVTYEAYDPWETMTIYVQMYMIILVVVIGFMAAGIFDEEFRNHAELVFFTAKYGRSKAAFNKTAAGMITATIVYWAGIGLLSLLSFGMIGTNGADTLYQLEEPYSIYVMTQGQRYLLIAVCGYIASLLSASVTMLATAKMRHAKIAVCIPFFLFCVMLFIGGPLSKVTKAVQFTPDTLVNVVRAMKVLCIFQIGNAAVSQIAFVMILYSLAAAILLPLTYRSYSGYGFTKRRGIHLQKRNRVRRVRK